MKTFILAVCVVAMVLLSTVECKSTINKRLLLERLLRRLNDAPVIEEPIIPEEAQNTGENGGNPDYNPFEERSLKTKRLQQSKKNQRPVIEEPIIPEGAQNTGENGGNPDYNPFEERSMMSMRRNMKRNERYVCLSFSRPVIEEPIIPEEAQKTGENGGNPDYNPFEERSMRSHLKRNERPVVEEPIIRPEESHNTGENGGNPDYNPFEE
ncbi:uncharacterized protein LOC116303478 isoform X1 [Actinia tenebrosa]|uniref:Uncharacterized protein LOC116303478 isoform X1 n=1 Tax=Actinia tenebrosa TaxID=6105 RepID=A0A6P8IRM0_ACTTE|nr:uncharacterized protein LOC116303478 isoform X1 [Actinia tenebrosa]XP_031568898.1 uncharacterized protein LOC116303478 isoform X1 [Actinia tenebrosa]